MRLFIFFLLAISQHVYSQTITITSNVGQLRLNTQPFQQGAKIELNAGKLVTANADGYITKGADAESIINSLKLDYNFELQKEVKPIISNGANSIRFNRVFSNIIRDYYAKDKFNYGSRLSQFNVNLDDNLYKDGMNDCLEGYGFKVIKEMNEEFFAKPSSDLVLTGEIISFARSASGKIGYKVSLIVRWTLYNADLGTNVYKIESAGFSDSHNTNDEYFDLENKEIILAMKDALKGVLADPGFMKIVNDGPVYDLSYLDKIYLKKINQPKFDEYSDMIQSAIKSSVTIKGNNLFGSGFIVSKDGYILTSSQVVRDTNNLVAILSNNLSIKARVIRSFPMYNIALLKIDVDGLVPLPLDFSGNALILGNEVSAIGISQDIKLEHSVVRGIISANRILNGQKFIQLDMSINPGNLGAPVLTNNGEVIGIILYKYSNEKIEGLGFAIPIDIVLRKLNIEITTD